MEDLQSLCDEREELLNIEKKEHGTTCKERDNLKLKCMELEEDIEYFTKASFDSSKKSLSCDIGSTPPKTQTSDSSGLRTPTSQVLAKALRSELKKSHSISDRVIESERALAEANIKLSAATHDLK
eukprot:597328-Ditylum_brightwellii.AAC.1